jgi:hypothetical protein
MPRPEGEQEDPLLRKVKGALIRCSSSECLIVTDVTLFRSGTPPDTGENVQRRYFAMKKFGLLLVSAATHAASTETNLCDYPQEWCMR